MACIRVLDLVSKLQSAAAVYGNIPVVTIDADAEAMWDITKIRLVERVGAHGLYIALATNAPPRSVGWPEDVLTIWDADPQGIEP